MKKKIAITIFLTILVLQPLIAMVGVGAEYTPVEVSSVFSVAQDPGVRLSPDELTNHVPVIINKTNDFVNQGWPGSGTELDPYMVSGLSIVADVDLTCIVVQNTTAYFLIQDCYIDQGSILTGISLENTTHGTIEYTTVHSEGPGIYAINSNNTLISHVYSGATNGMALQIENTFDWTIEYNTFNSTNHRAFRADYSIRVNSMNNHYRNYKTGWFTTVFEYTNFTTSTNDYFEGGNVDAIRMSSCTFTSISGAGVYDQDEGFEFINCVNTTITDCTMEMLTDEGIILTNSPNVTITNVRVTDTLTSGFYFANSTPFAFALYPSGNITLRNCTVENAGANGVYADTIENLFISGLTLINIGFEGISASDCDYFSIMDGAFSEIGSSGIFLGDCNYLTFENLNMETIGSDGIYGDTCANGMLTNSYFQEVDGYGMQLESAENWTVSGNTLNEIVDAGIYLSGGPNQIVYNNTLSMIDAEGIYLDVCPDSNVYENTITDCTDDAISVSDSERSSIFDNSLTRCYSGIYVGNSENTSILENSLLDIMDFGIDLWSGNGLYVANNTVSGARVGVSTYLHYNLTLNYNVLTDCGFFFGGGLSVGYYEYSMTGNTVNGLPVYLGLHETSGSIDGTTYGQILLVNCTNFDINGGTFDRVTIPIELLHCEYVDIVNLTSFRNGYSVYLYLSDNVTIFNAFVDGYGSAIYGAIGVYASYSDDIIIQDSTFTRCNEPNHGSLDFSDCVDVDIINCEVTYGKRAMYFDDTANVTILDSEILHNFYSGIQFWDDPCQYIHIERNLVYNSTRGIYGDQASQWIVRNNTLMHNTQYGLYIGSSQADYGNISLNTIESNRDAIYIASGDYHYIYDNTIRWNTRYGVYLSGVTGAEVFYNIIAYSGIDNAYDSLSGTNWNATTLGNWWDDFTPPAPYLIDGDSTDEHPMVYLPAEPIIDHPMDYVYAEGADGNTITWQPVDDALKNWEVWIDGVFWDGDAWDFIDVTVNVDGLAYGLHTLEVIVWDVDMNNVTDIVLVHVFDDTAPGINGPANTVSFLDATGQLLTWEVSDLHPGTYEVVVNGEVVETGTWTAGTVDYNIDDLDLGVNQVTLYIYDLDMNSAGASVLVEVVDDDDSPTIDHPDDMEIVEGTTGNQIVWSPSDDYPDRFEVLYNGSTYVTDSWGGSRIVVSIDGLPAGTHTFSLTVYDGAGNQVSDEVVTTVLAVEPETTPAPPPDYSMILMVGAVAGAVIVVVIVVYVLKKRRAA